MANAKGASNAEQIEAWRRDLKRIGKPHSMPDDWTRARIDTLCDLALQGLRSEAVPTLTGERGGDIKGLCAPKLLPCPFCGGEAAPRWSGGVYLIECQTCHTSKGDNGGDDFEAEAVANWNRRAA